MKLFIHSQTSTVQLWKFGNWKLHPTLSWACDYVSMLGLKLNHVSKRGYWCCCDLILRQMDITDIRTGIPVPDKSETHDDVIKWKHFPRNWPFVRRIHRSPVNSRHKGQWRGALMFSLICVWINDWVNNREVGNLRRHRAHCDVIVETRTPGINVANRAFDCWAANLPWIYLQLISRRFQNLKRIW